MSYALMIALALTQSPTMASEQFAIERNEDGVLIREGDRKVLFYQQRPKSLEGRFERANYVHPLYGLDGEVLTEDFPADHRHHRGIFWAWHQLRVGNKPLGDGWTTEDFQWDVKSVDAETMEGIARLDAHVLWKSAKLRDSSGELIPVVEEQTTIRVHPGADSLRDIDFEIRLKALVPDVRLGGSDDEKGYGGFSVRVRLPEDLQFVGKDGPVEPRTAAVEAGPWLNLTATDWGLAILNHPSNPGFPEPWILRRQRSMQNPAFPGREPITLSQEEPLVLHYRLLVHRGQLDREAIDNLQAEWGR